jgi:hypothetical protein
MVVRVSGEVMNKKQSNPQQTAFDWLDTIPDQPVRRARPWYYITRNRHAEMLLKFDAYGKPVWVEHDLRQNKPHIYNCIQRAREAATRLRGEVKSCHYDQHAKDWVNYSVG